MEKYQKALAALDVAREQVESIASGLHQMQAQQTDVSARLSGRPTRYTGRKRKLSPCPYEIGDDLSIISSCAKADTPTQELLPASRSELRHHQLQAVRWLASLERAGAGGILADELEADRRAAVAGLLSHLAVTPPEPQPGPGPGPSVPPLPSNVCVVLAPGARLSGWAEAISEHVALPLLLHDGSAASAAEVAAACAAAGSQALRASQAAAHAGAPGSNITSAYGRRSATGGAPHDSSADAGGYPPSGRHHPHHHYHTHHPSGAPTAPPSVGRHQNAHNSHHGFQHASDSRKPLVILAPLEALQQDAAMLGAAPLRLLVVDLASQGGEAAAEGRAGRGGGGSAAGCGPGSVEAVRYGLSELGGTGPAGMDLAGEAARQLHLLSRVPAACRVLLSAGEMEPPGDGLWLLLQLLAPHVQRPLVEAVGELQQALLASGAFGLQCKDAVLREVSSRLWALLQPLLLARRAQDVELATQRATSLNLNLYDHFSAASAHGGA